MEFPPASIDEHWMQKALDLAAQGRGLVSPNPVVGAVIVRDEKVGGEGFHQYDLKKHAEIVALEQAGDKARGATLYVTLEPCSIHGRTPPCADAVISAGLSRVVVATIDPNPRVSGKGIERMSEAGISTQLGVLERAANILIDDYTVFITKRRPFLHLKIAQSEDGREIPPPGQRWITGEESREEGHRLRHRYDAILVGSGTIRADDPLLTDRSGLPRRRPLVRVVLDSKLAISPSCQVLRTVSESPVWIFTLNDDPQKREAIEATGAVVHRVESDGSGKVSIASALGVLGDSGVTSVLVEGGPAVWRSFLRERLADKISLFISSINLGPSFRDRLPFSMKCALESTVETSRGRDIEMTGYPAWDLPEELFDPLL